MWVVLMLVFADVVAALVVWGVAFGLRNLWGSGEVLGITVASLASSTVVWVSVRALLGLYPGYGLDAAETLRRETYSVGATLAMTAVFALAFQVGDLLSRLMLGLGFLILLAAAPLLRHLVKWGLMRFGLWGKPVAILGAGEAGAQLVRGLQREWGLGFKPVAVFDFRTHRGTLLEGVPHGGTVTDALDVARKHRIETVVFVLPHVRREHLARFVESASLNFRHVIVVPNLLHITNSAVIARDLAGTFGVEIKHNLLNPWALWAKRTLDLAATIVGGMLILPLLLAIAFAVWIESRGGVLYKAPRIGQEGKHFSCVKFRTMVPEAEAVLQRMIEENPQVRDEYLKYHKLRDDPRITRVGYLLRKTSLDELPQIWNVLRGEMSLVGPRPYLPRESEKIGTTQKEILRVPPGITGLWQVAGRSHTTFDERVEMEAYYVRNWSVWLDLVILARTIKTLFFSRTAY